MTVPAPARAFRAPLFDWFFLLAVAAVGGTLVRILAFTPFEASQGAAQKIYYIHVPAALSAYLALGILAVASVMFLWLRDPRADRLAVSAAEVGLLFTTLVITTGPLWAKPIWGTWWSWDMRLNLTMFLWFLTAAYLVLRGAIDDEAMRARFSAVLGVLAALLIPFIHLSVYLFRTMHPEPIVLQPGRPRLPAEMLTTWSMGVLAFAFLCIALIRARYRLPDGRDA
ncbi:MAG: cytochrome c biogenesis protein CcsA [Gemmatimonadota bacterium]|mgnify:CR=1 FL=1